MDCREKIYTTGHAIKTIENGRCENLQITYIYPSSINDNEIDTSIGNLTIDSAGGTITIDDQLIVTGITTFNNNVDLDQALNVDGNLNVSGLSTFVGIVTNQSTIFGNQISISGVSTFVGVSTFGDDVFIKDQLFVVVS